jgi:hypothetical protein
LKRSKNKSHYVFKLTDFVIAEKISAENTNFKRRRTAFYEGTGGMRKAPQHSTHPSGLDLKKSDVF